MIPVVGSSFCDDGGIYISIPSARQEEGESTNGTQICRAAPWLDATLYLVGSTVTVLSDGQRESRAASHG